ncbi:MAG: hypothetical protein ABIG45_04830, partial [Bacillota bacterium]
MKRVLCTAMLLLLLVAGASAQVVPQDASLRGEVFYPQGSAADTASFVYRYRLPQFPAGQPQNEAVNRYFQSYAADIVNAITLETAGIPAELPAAGGPAYYVNLDYRVTAETQEHLSVLLISQQFLGNTLVENWVSAVFALGGIYAGQPISLSQAMGLEQEETDQAGDYASELVYGLVWQI